MFFSKFYSQSNDLNTAKVIFFNVIRCYIKVYNFIFLKGNITIFFIPNIPN